jgi:hypothetical protein
VTQRRKVGKVVDYDGHRWCICRSNDTAGEVAYNFDLDAQVLVFENSNIQGLSRSARLHRFTPLLLGRGKSAFLSPAEAQRMLNLPTDDEFNDVVHPRLIGLGVIALKKKLPEDSASPSSRVSRKPSAAT